MGSIRRYCFRLFNSTTERKVSRSQLKAAKNEDHEQYLALAANYADLAQAYYGATVSEPAEIRIARVEQVFLGLWQHLRYAERLSDFEFMLASALIESAPEDGPIQSPEPLVTKLRLLDARTRFAFIAYEFEKWPIRWVTLVLRTKLNALHRLISEARCELCGVSWESLSDEERDCLVDVSVSLEKSPNLKFNKALSHRVSLYPRVSEIKSLWLELRPELVEVRHRYIPSQDERDQLLKNIFNVILESTMETPPFVDRMVNTVHFSRHRKIDVS
ncbi:MAG TPA: hypothetical protein DCX06_08005 [Opitutae bacterium]|nr:hypothetical protein [Opitutae bacterium]